MVLRLAVLNMRRRVIMFKKKSVENFSFYAIQWDETVMFCYRKCIFVTKLKNKDSCQPVAIVLI